MLQRIITAFFLLAASLLRLTPSPAPKCPAKVTGSFLQAFYCAGWDEARWDAETAWMAEAGLDTLILQHTAYLDENGQWTAYYPSELPVFRGSCAGDIIGKALKSCRKAGIRVFVGLAEFSDWWNTAGFSGDWDAVCDVMAQMQEEILRAYRQDYGDTLYGWYFAPEIDNASVMKLSLPRIIAGFNNVLDRATALEPAMPVLLSPFYSEYLTVPSVTATLPMWQTFLNAAHLRDGDIFCPQDAIGAAWTHEKSLEKVWQMYAAAVSSAKADVKLWANCENFTAAQSGGLFAPPANGLTENIPAPIDRFAGQLQTAGRYAEKLVCFSMNHYYSPYIDEEAYEAYLSYAASVNDL